MAQLETIGVDLESLEASWPALLTIEETARVLRVSTGTVERDWRAARAWLASELGAAS